MVSSTRVAMKSLVLALFLTSTAAAAPGQHCALRIEFGSYCCGPDGKLAHEIDLLLKERPQLSVDRLADFSGIEGEHGLCVQARSPADAREAFEAIRRLVPKYSRIAPTTVRLASGESFASEWPP